MDYDRDFQERQKHIGLLQRIQSHELCDVEVLYDALNARSAFSQELQKL